MYVPTIEKLSSLEGTWRVDWFGDVAYPDLNKRQSQPSVGVQFSLYPGPLGTIHKREEWLPIGLLPFLKVGDLWLHGQPTGESTTSSKETFSNLRINRETVHFCKAGGKPDPVTHGHLNALAYWLPLDEHPWHREHTHANCVVVTLSDQLRLIIPCMELIRFYFGSSSSLLSTLFRPTLSKTSLVKQYVRKPNDSVFLRLADGISGASAADIARIIYSQEAWRAASFIGRSAFQCSSVGERIYPKCHFPFEGTTNLSVSGQWLFHIGPEKTTFLVYQILSCSHEFPFKSIRYMASTNSNKYKAPDKTGGHRPPKREDQNNCCIALTDEDPDEKRHPKYFQFISPSARFPDLESKTIYRNPSFSTPSTKPCVATPTLAHSVGATGKGKGITPVELENGVEQDRFDIHQLPDFVQAGIASLQGARSFTVMTPEHHNDLAFPIPFIYEQTDKPYAACFIDDEQGERKRRLACCLQVDYVDRVEGAVILETANTDSPEIITFELAEEFLDIELMKKHLHAHITKQVSTHE